MIANGYQNYRRNTVEGATPADTILLVYKGAIKFMMLSRMGLGNRNIQEAHNNLVRSQDIVLELYNSLDIKIAPSLSGLKDFYLFSYNKLVEVNLRKDPVADIATLDEMIRLFRELLEAWEIAAKSQRLAPLPARDEASDTRPSVLVPPTPIRRLGAVRL